MEHLLDRLYNTATSIISLQHGWDAIFAPTTVRVTFSQSINSQ